MSTEPRVIRWLQDWDRQIVPSRQGNYMAAELERIQAEGEPLLYAAIQLPFMGQVDAAVKALRERLNYRMVFLRLVEGATPPEVDPDGKRLPPGKLGNTLVAKTGVRGQTADGKAPDSEEDTPMTSALGRDAIQNRFRESLYRTVEITRQPIGVPIDEAITILRQWGHGIPKEFRKREGRPDMCCWLVEEVPQRDGRPILDVAPPASPAPAGGNAGHGTGGQRRQSAA